MGYDERVLVSMTRKMIKVGILISILVGFLMTTGVAYAELKANSAAYAWDRTALSYQNSHVIIYWDGGWVPFIHEVDFDRIAYSPSSCSGGSTQYAGIMEFGLYHTDNNPSGAPGFQETRNWKLVNCDRNIDGRFDNSDRAIQPPEDFTQYATLSPVSQDVILPCSTGNCQDEIITTLEVNIDQDCNGSIDPGVPAHVCFYAEARVPTVGSGPIWQQTLQARVTAGGGDKTVSFDVRGPTALSLRSFSVSHHPINLIIMSVLAALILLALPLVLMLFWNHVRVVD